MAHDEPGTPEGLSPALHAPILSRRQRTECLRESACNLLVAGNLTQFFGLQVLRGRESLWSNPSASVELTKRTDFVAVPIAKSKLLGPLKKAFCAGKHPKMDLPECPEKEPP